MTIQLFQGYTEITSRRGFDKEDIQRQFERLKRLCLKNIFSKSIPDEARKALAQTKVHIKRKDEENASVYLLSKKGVLKKIDTSNNPQINELALNILDTLFPSKKAGKNLNRPRPTDTMTYPFDHDLPVVVKESPSKPSSLEPHSASDSEEINLSPPKSPSSSSTHSMFEEEEEKISFSRVLEEIQKSYEAERAAHMQNLEILRQELSDKQKVILGQQDIISRQLEIIESSKRTEEVESEKLRETLQENHRQKERIQSLERDLEKLRAENQRLANEKASAERNAQSLESKKEELEHQLKQLQREKQAEKAKLFEELETLKRELEEKTQSLQALSQEKEALAQEKILLEQNLQGINEKVERLESELEKLRTELKETQDLLLAEQQKNEELKTQIEKLKEEKISQNEEIRSLKEELARKKEELEQTIQSKDTEIARLQATIAKNAEEIETLKSSEETFQSDISSLKNQLKTQREEFDQTIKEKEEEILLKDRQLADATDKNNQLEKEIASLRASMEKQTGEIQALQDTQKTKETSITGLEEALATKNQEIENLNDANSRKDLEIAALKRQIAKKDEEFSQLNRAFDEADASTKKTLLEKNQQIAKIDDSLAQVTEEKRALDAQLKNLQKELEASREAISTLNTQNDSLHAITLDQATTITSLQEKLASLTHLREKELASRESLNPKLQELLASAAKMRLFVDENIKEISSHLTIDKLTKQGLMASKTLLSAEKITKTNQTISISPIITTAYHARIPLTNSQGIKSSQEDIQNSLSSSNENLARKLRDLVGKFSINIADTRRYKAQALLEAQSLITRLQTTSQELNSLIDQYKTSKNKAIKAGEIFNKMTDQVGNSATITTFMSHYLSSRYITEQGSVSEEFKRTYQTFSELRKILQLQAETIEKLVQRQPLSRRRIRRSLPSRRRNGRFSRQSRN